MPDRHLNLFCSYGNHRIEDNVTRALIVTLRRLSPVYQRLVLRDVLVPEERDDLRKRIQLTARQPLDFDLQVHASARGDEQDGTADSEVKLTSNTGILVGLHAGESSDVDLDAIRSSNRDARVDATIADPEGDVTAVVEVKLGPDLDATQMTRHRERFFDLEEEDHEGILSDVTWTDLIGYLGNLADQRTGREDEYVLREFISYADMLGLSPFMGFRRRHFDQQDSHTLERFVRAIQENIQTNPKLVPYEGEQRRIDFEGIDPNLWFDYGRQSLRLGIVCGAECKSRARDYRNLIVERTDRFRLVLEQLSERAADVDSSIDTVLRSHARFFGTYFRQEWLPEVGGIIPVPRETDRARELFGSKRINSHSRLSRSEITERFEPWLESVDDRRFGSDGMFPRWADLDEKGFLVRLYFHLDVIVPEELLASRGREECIETVGPLVQALSVAAGELASLRRA